MGEQGTGWLFKFFCIDIIFLNDYLYIGQYL